MAPHYFTWKGQLYLGDQQAASLFKWNGTAYVRTTDPADLAAAQEWWETQLPTVTRNDDGTAFVGPTPNRQSGDSSTLLILAAGLLFVILVARR